MLQRRSLLWLLSILLLPIIALIAVVVASPYWTMHQLRRAAQAGDIDTVMRHVDRDALRASARANVGAAFDRNVSVLRAAMERPGGAAREITPNHAIATAMLDELASNLSSPVLVISMLVKGSPSSLLPNAHASAILEAVPIDWHVQLRYEDWRTVHVYARESAQWGGFVLKRHGLLNWKLSGFDLPAT